MMNDDEIKCLCKKLSEANRKIITLECKNYGLEKENERLNRRIDLLENTQVQQHYDSEHKTFSKFERPLDMYTLEKIYHKLDSIWKNLDCANLKDYHISKGTYNSIRLMIWNMLDEDSQRWIKLGREKYYSDEDE